MKLHPMWQDYPDLAEQLTTTLELMENVVKLKIKSRGCCTSHDPRWRKAAAPCLSTLIFTIWTRPG